MIYGIKSKYVLLNTGMEATGAVASPANKIGVNKYAPRSVQVANNKRNVYTLGTINGIGNSRENKPYELSKNIGVGIIGNSLGNAITNKMYGGVGMPIARNAVNGIISQPVQSGLSNTADKIDNYWNNKR